MPALQPFGPRRTGPRVKKMIRHGPARTARLRRRTQREKRRRGADASRRGCYARTLLAVAASAAQTGSGRVQPFSSSSAAQPFPYAVVSTTAGTRLPRDTSGSGCCFCCCCFYYEGPPMPALVSFLFRWPRGQHGADTMQGSRRARMGPTGLRRRPPRLPCSRGAPLALRSRQIDSGAASNVDIYNHPARPIIFACTAAAPRERGRSKGETSTAVDLDTREMRKGCAVSWSWENEQGQEKARKKN